MQLIEVVVADGVTLRVRNWPGRLAPAYLLVHGLSSNARLWDEVAAIVNDAGYPVYAVDLRSHGESDSPDSGYDTATAATDLATLLARLRAATPSGDDPIASPVIVAGQSWGGNVVVRLAAKNPELIAALALVDGGWIDLTCEFDTWQQCLAQLTPPPVDGATGAQLRSLIQLAHPDWSLTALEATMANFRERPDGTLVRRLPVAEHLMILRSMWDQPPWLDFATITAPVLLMPAIAADDEAALSDPHDTSPEVEPAATGRVGRILRAARAMPQARIRPYAGADHDLHAQHPHRVAQDLLSLARHG